MKVISIFLAIFIIASCNANWAAKFRFIGPELLQISVKHRDKLKSVIFNGNINMDIDRMSVGTIQENLIFNNDTGLWSLKMEISLNRNDSIAYYLLYKFERSSYRHYDIFDVKSEFLLKELLDFLPIEIFLDIPEYIENTSLGPSSELGLISEMENTSPSLSFNCHMFIKVLDYQESNRLSVHSLGVTGKWKNSTKEDLKSQIENYLFEKLNFSKAILPIMDVELKNDTAIFKVNRLWKKNYVLIAAEELKKSGLIIKEL